MCSSIDNSISSNETPFECHLRQSPFYLTRKINFDLSDVIFHQLNETKCVFANHSNYVWPLHIPSKPNIDRNFLVLLLLQWNKILPRCTRTLTIINEYRKYIFFICGFFSHLNWFVEMPMRRLNQQNIHNCQLCQPIVNWKQHNSIRERWQYHHVVCQRRWLTIVRAWTTIRDIISS